MNKNSLSISNFKNFILKENTKFLLKLLLFLIMVIGYFNHVMPQYLGTVNSALLDKMERLEAIKEAKIVLIGNSNLSFGIRSELIESEFGMPVVNMGLHGGLGNRFHEDMARCNVTEGDIYILCHTSYADNGDIDDATLAWSTIENHFELWKLLRVSDMYQMMKGFPAYLKKCMALYNSGSGNQDYGGVYARSAYNKYGDICFERIGSEYTFTDPVNPPAINDITINRINELNTWLKGRGAVLLVAGYPIGKGELTAETEEFIKFQKELEERLDCAVISQYTDYMYDYSCFYNTNLHLNSETADIRTEQLIEDIKHWQESQTE